MFTDRFLSDAQPTICERTSEGSVPPGFLIGQSVVENLLVRLIQLLEDCPHSARSDVLRWC